jgi:hypothetical protein
VPFAFSASTSPVSEWSGAAGPLTVARLFRTAPCFDDVRRPVDFAMKK